MNLKKILSALTIGVAIALTACSEDIGDLLNKLQIEETAMFKNCGIDSIDVDQHLIILSKNPDSLIVETLAELGGSSYYIATDDDPVEPAFDWDNPLDSGAVIMMRNKNSVNIVVLDDRSRIVSVWTVRMHDVVELGSSDSETSSESSESSSGDSSDSSEIGSSAAENTESSESSEISSSETESTEIESSETGSSAVTGESSSSVNTQENTSSSSVENQGTEEDSESSSSVVLSSEKNVTKVQFLVNGESRNDFAPNSETKQILVDLSAETSSLLPLQVKRAFYSEGASSTLELNKDLELTQVSDFEYSYTFSVAAEDESSEEWSIIVKLAPGILLKDVSVENAELEVNDNRIYIELPYGSDLSQVNVVPLENAIDLRRETVLEFVDETGTLKEYSVIAGTQLPGFDDKTFWGSISDALATTAAENSIHIESAANALISKSRVELETVELFGSWNFGALGNIKGCQKAVTGILFTGSFTGKNAADLYDPSKGTECKDSYDFATMIKFGEGEGSEGTKQVFKGRPKSFEISYTYTLPDGASNDYQQALMYVMLVGENNVVVATGAVLEKDLQESGISRSVKLEYGKDSYGLLSNKFPKATDLELGTGDEEVTGIYVVFASSALANTVAHYYYNWVFGQSYGPAFGDVGAKLSVSEFKLVY